MNYAMPSLGNGSASGFHPAGFNQGHHLASSGSASSSRNGPHPAHANFKVSFEKLAFYEFLYEISAPIKMIGEFFLLLLFNSVRLLKIFSVNNVVLCIFNFEVTYKIES